MTVKPTLREGAKLELSAAASNSVYRVLEDMQNYPFKTCLKCDHFNEKDELCKLVNMRPPAKIIAFGCDKYADDDWIPF